MIDGTKSAEFGSAQDQSVRPLEKPKWIRLRVTKHFLWLPMQNRPAFHQQIISPSKVPQKTRAKK
jgi:hypothetical protein